MGQQTISQKSTIPTSLANCELDFEDTILQVSMLIPSEMESQKWAKTLSPEVRTIVYSLSLNKINHL